MKELPNPTYALSPVSLPGGYFIRRRSKPLWISSLALPQRLFKSVGQNIKTKFAKHKN